MSTKSQQIADRVNNIRAVSDFESVQLAVDWANTNNQALYWEEVYTVTGNVQNFHEVKHFGPGGVTRGGNTWYVEQSPAQQDRTLHVSSASGSNTNDGLDTTYPLQYEPYALTQMLKINPNNDEQGFITLKNDHVIVDASMMTVNKVNAGWIVINSDGTYGESNHTYASAYPSSGWTLGTPNPVTCSCTASTASRYIVGWEANMPELRVYVDGNAQLDRLYSGNRSTGLVAETYGGQNFRVNTNARPLYNSGGTIDAGRTVWENFTGSIYFARGAAGNLTQAYVKDRQTSVNGSLTVSRTANVAAQGIEFDDCKVPIEVKRGASLNALDCLVNDCDTTIATVSRGGVLAIDGLVATDIHLEGVSCSRAGTISMGEGTSQDASITASSSSAGTEAAVKCSGGMISMPDATINGASLGSGFQDGILCQQSGTVDASGVTIQGDIARNAISSIGGDINVTSLADTSGVVGATNELSISKGGIIRADAITTTSGALVAGDTNVGALDTLSTNGVIFS